VLGLGARPWRLVVAAVLAVGGLTGCVWHFADQGTQIRAGTPLALPMVADAAGEGVVHLTLAAPGTAWVSTTATSVVVDATLDAGPSQSFVLYAGAAAHTYSGFTGAIAAGLHTLTITVRGDLSSPPNPSASVLLQQAELDVVTPNDPGYLALAHAPVIYGRSVNAHSDTPLLAFAAQQALGGGAVKLSYTQFWSNEDAGTGAIPFLLWSEFGRTTDIESSIELTLDAQGAVTAATYQTCAQCPPNYPENTVGLDHTFVPFTGQYFAGTHPILRVATGNNVFSEVGTTPFRFQPTLAPPPAVGEVRESVMDPYPVAWQVMADEMRREQATFSTDPLNLAAGDARQYAIVDIDTTPVNASAVAVQVQLTGDPTWYASDENTGLKLYTGGHSRTAVKLPLDWHNRAITGLRLRLYPAVQNVVPTITVNRLEMLELDGNYVVHTRALPAPVIVTS
jgi:hypothetical protein